MHAFIRTLLLPLCLCTLPACHRGPDEVSTGATYGGARVWGSGAAGAVDGNAGTARFSNPANVEVAADGSVYVADFDNDLIRKIDTAGVVSTLVQRADFQRPFGITFGFDGFLYVQTDGNDLGARNADTGTVWKVDLATGAASVVVRDVGRPRGLMALPDGRIVLSDLAHHDLRLLDPDTGTITPLAGTRDTAGFADGTGAAALFDRPYGVALAPNGALLVADQNNNRIRQVTLAGAVTTFAGGAVAGNGNGPVATATLRAPQDVEIVGNAVFVAEPANHVIRRILGGAVTTFAGTGVEGFADGSAAQAQFFGLEGIASSPDGRLLFIADGNGGSGDPFNRVRFLPTGL